MKWATLLAAVAVRVERLKYLARNEPDTPATIELSTYELRALVLLKKREKKRTEGGPPGAVTIGRGLARVQIAAAVLEELALEPDQK